MLPISVTPINIPEKYSEKSEPLIAKYIPDTRLNIPIIIMRRFTDFVIRYFFMLVISLVVNAIQR
jgi:hypothetical protein